jgi:hypothetical protein
MVSTLSAAAGSSCLLIDDFDAEFDWQSLWLRDRASCGITPEVIDVSEATAERLSQADVVLWNCGNDTTGTLMPDNQAALDEYLYGGGRLLLVAPGMPGELIDASNRPSLTNPLRCDYVMLDCLVAWGTVVALISLVSPIVRFLLNEFHQPIQGQCVPGETGPKLLSVGDVSEEFWHEYLKS